MKQIKLNRLLMLLVAFLTMCVTQVWAESTVTTYTFNSKSWGATCNGSAANWTGSADGNQYSASSSPIGVQILAAGNGTTVTSPKSFTNVSKVVVNYSSSGKGVGSIKVSVGGTDIDTKSISKSQSKVDLTYTPSTNLTGEIVITCNCTTNSYALVSVSVTEESGASNTPTITKLGTLTAFTTTYGEASAEQSFTVGGSNLTADITVSAPTNYEISKTTGTGFGSSVSLTKDGSGNVANTTLYVRLKNNIDAGSVAKADITCSSDGATNQTISIPASKVQSKVNWSVNGSAAAGSPTLAVDKTGKVTTLPTAPTSSDCDGSKVFVGWTDNAIASPTNTKPSTLFTAASGAPTVNANEVTYYAVFATQAGGSSSLSYGWEGTMSSTDWEKNSLSDGSSYNTYKHTGSYAGSTGSATTAYIKTKDKIASPTSAICYYTKASSNNNSSSKFIIQVSTNGTSWTDVSTGKTMNNVTQGTFEELTADLSSYSNVYVRFYYTGTSATRVLDDVSVSYGSYTYSNYTTTCGPATYTASIVAPVNGSFN